MNAVKEGGDEKHAAQKSGERIRAEPGRMLYA